MKPKAQYWIDLSDYDFETAISLLNGKRYLYVAFMCHQSIEKALKAYLTEKSMVVVPYTHSLSHLVSKCELQDILSTEQNDFLDKLEPMNIEARYPTYKEQLLKQLDFEYCNFLINETRKFREWIKHQL